MTKSISKNNEIDNELAKSLGNYINQMKDPLTVIYAYADLLINNFLSLPSKSISTEAVLTGQQIKKQLDRLTDIMEKINSEREVEILRCSGNIDFIVSQKHNNYTSPEPKTILVIEDDPNLCKVLHDILTNAGFGVETFSNGFDALEEIKNKNYSVAIIDVNMPEINGYETFKKIVLHCTSNKIQIPATLMITGYDMNDLLQLCIADGAYSTLRKPFTNEEILKEVNEAENFSQKD